MGVGLVIVLLVDLRFFYWSERTLTCLGAFAKLRKATISFVMSVLPPVCPYSAPSGQI